jgi:hypothetical protein
MGFEPDAGPPSRPVPRVLAGPYAAQDAAARAAGLPWHDWAQRALEEAARGALGASAGEPRVRRLVGAERGRP